MSDNIQLNIVIPQKNKSTPQQANSKQKRYEKYMDRKKKKREKALNRHNPSNFGLLTREEKPIDTENGDKMGLISSKGYTENPQKPKFPPPKFKSILKQQQQPSNKQTNNKPSPAPQITQAPLELPKMSEIPSVFASEEFTALPINDHLKKVLHSNNYTKMTKIQQISIPEVLSRKNCLVKSETGSGKTLCYLVPILELLMKRVPKISREEGVFALILCPTRELCIQVDEEARKLSKAAIWVVHGAIMGGESIKKEKARLRQGINVLISTPGRLVYHLQNSTSFKLTNLEFFILEESDRTLDMGFSKDLSTIIDMLVQKTQNFEKVQKVLISANFSQKIRTLSLKMASKDIRYIGWDEEKGEEKNAEGGDFFKTEETLKIPKTILQTYARVKEDQRFAFVIGILRKPEPPPKKYMIFVATIDEVEFLSFLFLNALEDLKTKYSVFKLHGDIDQKTRTSTFLDFKRKKMDYSVLIATDVASRGLDFTCVDITILTSIPPRAIDYCNSIGRTGRIDQPGLSILLLNEQELGYLEELKGNGIHEVREYTQRIEGLERIRHEIGQLVRNDSELKMMAKRAYGSFMRAYNRNQKGRFFLKALNLQDLARNFGVGGGGKLSKDEEFQKGIINRKEDLFREKIVRKNVIKNVKDLEKLEFG